MNNAEIKNKHLCQTLEMLIDGGADINYRCWAGIWPLITAIENLYESKIEVMKLLIDKGS